MKGTNKFIILAALCIAGASLNHIQAAMQVFTIDNSQSPISIGPGSTFAGFAVTAQGPGSLSNSYYGSINVDLSASTIQFSGGSAINARTNGVWQPAPGGVAGSGPANYGAQAQLFGFYTAYAAIRHLSLDVTSATLPLSGTNFNGTNLIFSIASSNAVADYYSSIESGSKSLTGYATNALAAGFTVTTNGGKQTLTIPISAQFAFTVISANDTKVNLIGQIVATNSGAAAPLVIKSIVLSNQNVVVTAGNATIQSQLLVSSNLTAWAPAPGVVVTTNASGETIFTAPANGTNAFFQVKQ